MIAALVKIDVAAARLGWSAAKLFDLVDGGTLIERGFVWVWNLANDPTGIKRDLRFWWPEIDMRASLDTSKHRRFTNYELEWVINKILPASRTNFHAGEVDELFQIRPRTRIDLHDEICGTKLSGRNSYTRDILAAFLERRWLHQRDDGDSLSPATNGGRTQVPSPNNMAGVGIGESAVVKREPSRNMAAPSIVKTAAGSRNVHTSHKSSAKTTESAPASPATTKQRRRTSNSTAPASLPGAVTLQRAVGVPPTIGQPRANS
jgi:hypothetical protein